MKNRPIDALNTAMLQMIFHRRLAGQSERQSAKRLHSQAERYYRRLAVSWERIFWLKQCNNTPKRGKEF